MKMKFALFMFALGTGLSMNVLAGSTCQQDYNYCKSQPNANVDACTDKYEACQARTNTNGGSTGGIGGPATKTTGLPNKGQ